MIMENEQRVYGYVKSIAEEQFAKKGDDFTGGCRLYPQRKI